MPTKQSLYAKEQEQIIQSLIDILDLHNTSSFIRYHLDHDDQLIVRVMSLVPSIRLYFASSAISGISEPHKLDRPYLSIIRYLLKDHYSITSKDIKHRLPDGRRIRTTQYFFSPKTK
jgi:hypothetical protein